ncbi:MAG: 3-dehydroquinate synthase [Salinivirgaceae bacterium]|nr:3-dehydroquinate synthase [Salinivirgaceae bacterium]MDD4746459.1 3-dehydroquinate synthase [Salinivirgaceae bacterium]
MREFKIETKNGTSNVIVGESIKNVLKYLPTKDVFIITDSEVYRQYASLFPSFAVFEITPGETSKSFDCVTEIYSWLIGNEANRHSFVLGIGGGVVSDIAGFVASTYMRGVEFGFVSTTLLSQVDASVGGKNGLNFGNVKNVIGTIRQPKFVLCDGELLSSLSEPEYVAGLAEVVKHALIADYEMFKFLENHYTEVLNRSVYSINYMVERSVAIKSAIVQADEFENNIRKKLNLGHTWGHAVEVCHGLRHGESISIGLVFAAQLSLRRLLITHQECDRIVGLLRKLGLPTIISGNFDKILSVVQNDKKRFGKNIDFVLMQGVGSVEIERIALSELHEFVATFK